LEGLKVTHDLSQLEDGESHILTLKDSRILDNEGNASSLPPLLISIVPLTTCLVDDELQNVEMAEAERTKERNELKIKRRDYTGYDDEEFVEGREGMKRRILSKYDEFLEGPKETVSHNRVIPHASFTWSCRAFGWVVHSPQLSLPHEQRSKLPRQLTGHCSL
jgi:U4/U6.U5 tri-snRNP-associated protein 1